MNLSKSYKTKAFLELAISIVHYKLEIGFDLSQIAQ